jgi:hypothetical protein
MEPCDAGGNELRLLPDTPWRVTKEIARHHKKNKFIKHSIWFYTSQLIRAIHVSKVMTA